jgi:hypothetical protein
MRRLSRRLPGGGTPGIPFASDQPGFDKVTMGDFFSAAARAEQGLFYDTRIELYPGEIDKLWKLADGVAQGEMVVMAGPAQAERPASGGGEVDDRRAGASGHLPGHGLVRAVEGGLNAERGKWPPGNHL